MSRPKILDDLYDHIHSKVRPHSEMNWISSDDTEDLGEESFPIDANTLEGHPASYFVSKTEVSQILSNYIATVLGNNY